MNELDGVNYCILGTDSGTELCVSLADHHLYSVDFNKLLGVDQVCFINSSIIKFIQTIQLFITFQKRSQVNKNSEKELIAEMKQQMKLLDPKSLEDGNTWWSIVINQPY